MLKIPKNWNKQIQNIIIDFSVDIEIIRSSTLSDYCSNTQSILARYMCKATPFMRFANDTNLIRCDVIHKSFTNMSHMTWSKYL